MTPTALTALLVGILISPGSMPQLPPHPKLLELEAKLSAGDLATVAREVREFLASNRDHPGGLHLLGRSAYIAAQTLDSSGNSKAALSAYSESERAFQRLKNLAPTLIDTRVEQSLAICALRRGARNRAMDLARNAVVLAPENPTAHRIRGECALANGLKEEARSAFERGCLLAPGDIDLHLLLATQMQAQGKPTEATTLLSELQTRLSERSRKSWKVSLRLYRIRLTVNDIEGATQAVAEAARLSPENAVIALEHGNALYQSGEMERAEKALLRARELGLSTDETAAVAARILGLIQRHRGELQSAKQLLEEAVELDRGDLAALQSLAGVLRRLGDDAGARLLLNRFKKLEPSMRTIRDCRRGLASNPSSLQLRARLIATLTTVGKLAEAQRELEVLRRNHPGARELDALARGIDEASKR